MVTCDMMMVRVRFFIFIEAFWFFFSSVFSFLTMDLVG